MVGRGRVEHAVDIGEYAFVVFAVLLYSTVGALITSRQPANRVGLLFAWVGLSASISLLAGSYAIMAQQRDLPFLASSAWVGGSGSSRCSVRSRFLFLIFPTGRPLSRRWGWLCRSMMVAYAVTLIGFALTPGSLTAGFAELPSPVANPIGFPLSWKPAIEAVTTAAGFLVFVGALLSVVSLIQRYRRAAQLERQQIRWLAFLGVFLGVILLISMGLFSTGIVSDDGVASGVAIEIVHHITVLHHPERHHRPAFRLVILLAQKLTDGGRRCGAWPLGQRRGRALTDVEVFARGSSSSFTSALSWATESPELRARSRTSRAFGVSIAADGFRRRSGGCPELLRRPTATASPPRDPS